MRIYLSIIIIISGFINLFSQTTLPNIQGQILWLKADSVLMNNDSTVYEWVDLSPMHTSIFQTDTNNQPIYADSIINNKPTIKFNGNQWLNGGDICDVSDSGITIFIVAKSLAQDGSLIAKSKAGNYQKRYSIFFYNNNINFLFHDIDNNSGALPASLDSFFITRTEINFSILQSKLIINSNTYTSLPISYIDMNSVYDFLVGAYNNAGGSGYPPYHLFKLTGDIAEIIIYDRPLSNIESSNIEHYLYYKYFPLLYQEPTNLGVDIYVPYGYCDTVSISAESRFTNYLWSTGDTTQTITVNSSGQYSVTVTDIFGFESYDTVMVYYPSPAIQSDSVICYGDTIKWNAGLQDTNYTFLWQDNSTDSIISINTEDNYYVQITDTFGCVYNSDTAHITINNYPITTGLGADDTLCAGQNLFLQTGVNETINYLWNNGDTTNFTIINSAGDYSITATNNIGCIATDTVNIQIQGYAPIPGFDYTNTCFNDNTVFTDTSQSADASNIINWNWNFGNGETSAIQNPQLQYLDTGNYQVILTITTDSACENTITKNIRINPLPIANYSYTQLCEKNDIQFSNLSTVATGNIANSLWSFGNGDTSTIANPIYNYNNYGNYTIQLQVITNNNCKDTLTKAIEVKPSPETNFYFGATCKGEIVNFYNNTSTLVYNQVLEYYWNFGDGNNSTNENVNHLFDINDTLNTVSLYAKTVNGCSFTKTQQIIMHNIPATKILANGICQKNLITLTEESYVINDTISTYNWQINNDFYTEQNPTITIDNAGNANITLKVSSINGCIGTNTKQIPVYELPNPDFTVNPEYGIVNELTSFTPTDTLENNWVFGNGTSSTDTVAYTTYTDSGTYTINHYSINHYSCIDSVSKEYLVVVPRQDIAITNIETEIKNNKLYTSVNVINLGNLPIYNIEFTVNPENLSPITENWTGELLFGGVLPYTFNSIYNITETPSYVCVTANLIGKYPDQNPSDNTKCTNENTDFELFPIYPNPTSENITIKFSLPEKGQVDINLIDNLGKTISKLYSQETQKGISIIYFNLPKLNDGVYTIQVKYKNVLKSMKFIKTAK